MNTLLFIVAGVVLALVASAKIPGMEHLVKPLVNMAFAGLQVAAANASYWVVWLAKLLLASHTDLVRHLLLSAEAIDPTMAVRDNET